MFIRWDQGQNMQAQTGSGLRPLGVLVPQPGTRALGGASPRGTRVRPLGGHSGFPLLFQMYQKEKQVLEELSRLTGTRLQPLSRGLF